LVHLNPLQQIILEGLRQYLGQLFRSGRAKMLVGAKSWQDTSFPEYGRFSHYRRKDVANQIEIMLQLVDVRFDSRNCLIPLPSHKKPQMRFFSKSFTMS